MCVCVVANDAKLAKGVARCMSLCVTKDMHLQTVFSAALLDLNRYMETQDCPAAERCLRGAAERHLSGFSAWARANAQPGGDLSDAEVCMCGGVWQPILSHDRARIKGVSFACERLQHNSKLKSCVVMSKVEWRNPSHGPVRVGIVRRFFTYRPPWVNADGEVLNVADVKWMKPYNCTSELDGAAVVSRHLSLQCEQGDLVRVEDIIPTYICLVPHLDSRHADRWQVLHTDCNFTTKEY